MRNLATARCLSEISGGVAPAPPPAAAAAVAATPPPPPPPPPVPAVTVTPAVAPRCVFGYIMTVPLGAELANNRCDVLPPPWRLPLLPIPA